MRAEFSQVCDRFKQQSEYIVRYLAVPDYGAELEYGSLPICRTPGNNRIRYCELYG